MSSFPYEKAQKESVPCNFCKSNDLEILAREGQDGLPLTTVICKKCGLIFINPRMTSYWYGRYYQEEYRAKTIGHDAGRGTPDSVRLFSQMERHGEEMAMQMKGSFKGGTILEVGSSLGGVLAGIKKVLKIPVVGIEPSRPEANYAGKRGIKTYPSLIEDIEKTGGSIGMFGAVVCTQSLNHFLDPRYFFEFAHRHLSPDGILVLEVMNFRHQLKKAGKFKNAVKIDHTYMYTPETLKAFVEAAGFDILTASVDEWKGEGMLRRLSRALPTVHMTCIARKSGRTPFAEVVPKAANYRKIKRSLNKVKIYFGYLFNYRLRKLLHL